MRFPQFLLPGLLLLAASTSALSQSTSSPAPELSALPDTPPRKVLVKLGLNVARGLSYGGYEGLRASIPVVTGIEYSVSPGFTLYSQLGVDVSVPTYRSFYRQNAVTPSASLSLGGRYYYNQAARARNNKPHGPFVGNYLAFQANLDRFRSPLSATFRPEGRWPMRTTYAPGVTMLWGMQRRLGSNFLFDLSTGLGVSGNVSGTAMPGYTTVNINFTPQVNLGFYLAR
ncbi:hypothetical protein LJY25_04010 [Hymenobacter sp. BT175]|uniref:hypothetical protein n=1 Tax=Hymenobacter translucens TaxID=2886507 RepID=UPI001D0DFF73|nr:hypothetical protein [Hymenobacter translucens]MCC2545597.1 hypothetical protein [Hymenobacter translucens]